MTKKAFKELCRFELYTGVSRRINAIFYDYKRGEIDGKYFGGYKFRVSANVKDCTKKELINILYDWVINEKPIPWYANYKYVETDMERFKPPLSLNE
jgi:hypothetical protein